MAEGMGLLAGLCALGLIFALAAAFFQKCGVLRRETLQQIRTSGALCFGVGALFFAFGYLLRFLAFGPEEALCPPWEVFFSSGIRASLEAVKDASSVIALPGHALGLLFSGNFPAGGMTFSFLILWLSLFLILRRLSALFGEKAALRLTFLLLSLPGMFLCFLPGAASYLLLAAAAFLTFVFRKRPRCEFTFPPFLWESLLALFSVLSSALVFVFSTGMLS